MAVDDVDVLDVDHETCATACAASRCFAAADTVGQLRTCGTVLAIPLCWRHADLLAGPLTVYWWDSGI